MENKKEKKKLLDGKNKKVIFGTIIFAVIGVISLVVGFGLANGWESVLKWFTSRWAIYFLILLILGVFVLLWVLHEKKMRR